MAKINLLPWREERREQKRKSFITTCIAVALFGVVLSGAVWFYYNQELEHQTQANQTIISANTELDSKLKSLDGLQARRDEILQRIKLIHDLQGVRPVIVHVFEEIARVTPANMYLTSFSRSGDTFTLNGKAKDPNVVADFLKGLSSSPWFRNAFMNSFVAAEVKPVQQGAVTPREEDSYGTFMVTVDLGDINAISGINVVPAGLATNSAVQAPATPPPQPSKNNKNNHVVTPPLQPTMSVAAGSASSASATPQAKGVKP